MPPALNIRVAIGAGAVANGEIDNQQIQLVPWSDWFGIQNPENLIWSLCRQTRDDHRRGTVLQPELSSKAAVLDLTATLEAERTGQSVTQNVGLHKKPGSA